MCQMRRVLSRLASCASLTKRCLSSAPDRSKNTLTDVVRDLKTGATQRVVVMAGAGISTESGIPDFRSPGTGLYSNLQKYPTLPYPEAIFDLDYFFRDPRPFFTLAQELYPSARYRPNTVHYFIRLLHEKGLLLRLYTQNIDGLERLAGIPTEKLVEAHGSFATATCCQCGQSCKGDEIKATILKGEIPYCTKKNCEGVIKPDIVFFGENLPGRFYLHTEDVPQAELLLIMGTSLEVYPFAGIADLVLPDTPRILVNRDIAGPFRYQPRDNDIAMRGDLVHEVLKFCESLGWNKELEQLQTACEEETRET